MKLKQRTIKALSNIITGDEGISPYRSGPKLVALFNEFGADDTYGQGFPSRWMFAEEKLNQFNGTEILAGIICHVFDPREFMDTEFEVENAVEYLNKRMEYDGYVVAIERGHAKVRDVDGSSVSFNPFGASVTDTQAFIDEQIEKSERKILEGDYDGAITNARSLVEAVLQDLESELSPNPPDKYDGDLLKLYKRVQKLLSLEPTRPDIDPSLRQVLTGLVSIMNGIASARNKMSDAHPRKYVPTKHHAVLVVNSAKTVANFLYATTQYQAQRA